VNTTCATAIANSTGTSTAACQSAAGTPNNRSAYDAGLVLGFGPFQAGSSFEHQQNARGSGASNNVVDAGVVWTIGPFSTSLNWSRGWYDNFAGQATAKLDIAEIIFDYVLGPGVSVGAAFQYNKYRSGVDPDVSQSMHDQSIQFGTAFTF
jgi:predicted porin